MRIQHSVLRLALALTLVHVGVMWALVRAFPASDPAGWRVVYGWSTADRSGSIVMSLDGRMAERLVYQDHEVGRAACSPNGRALAFLAADALIVVEAGGGERALPLAALPWRGIQAGQINRLSIADDGDTLLVSLTLAPGRLAVDRVQMRSGDVTRVIDQREPHFVPAVSPDGSQLAVVVSPHMRVGRVSTYLFSMDGRGRLLVDDAWLPAWSPDGGVMAYTEYPNALALLDLTRALHWQANVRRDTWDPAWSPDGRLLFYMTVVNGADRIGWLDLHTRRESLLPLGDGYRFRFNPCVLAFTPSALLDEGG
jgi:Tol biopolymer transport system component